MSLRKIIHIDMDAFYASVEQRDVPSLAGKPVVVGGQPDSRGVVAACSYEARAYGVRSAMPCAQAYRLCPDAVFVKARFETYREVSQQVREIFAQFTDMIEPVSLDEAYLDVTDNDYGDARLFDGSATGIANEIRRRIRDKLKLTSSAGISYNKFLAKIASDVNKPNGFFVVTPEDSQTFIGRLPVGRINGVGTVTEKKMHASGIYLGADLRRKSLLELSELFGKSGKHFYNIARGVDERPVRSSRERKSLGSERTFENDLIDVDEIELRLLDIAESLELSLQKRKIQGRTITIKLKYADFTQITRSKTLENYTDQLLMLRPVYKELLQKTDVGEKPIRLLGLSVSGFPSQEEFSDESEIDPSRGSQMGLF